MTTVLYKWFWAWDFDKEEAWLNQKAAEGLALCGCSFCRYTFEPCEPGEYAIRMELLENMPDTPKSRDYLDFLAETGVQCVGRYLRWVYLRKKCSAGSFDLFSDVDSRIRHLDRLLAMLAVIGGMELFFGLNNLWLAFASDFRTANFGASIPCLALGGLIFYGFFRNKRKRDALKKERLLHE